MAEAADSLQNEEQGPTPAPQSENSISESEVNAPKFSAQPLNQSGDDSINSSQAIEFSLEAGNIDNSLYYIKWVKFNNFDCPIITQNENGPCPLIAIINVLLLRKTFQLQESLEYTTTTNLMKHIGHHLINRVPEQFSSEEEKLNYEHNISDAFSVICKLQSGIDVNIGFSSVTCYELTPEIVIFDILGIKLYHGWLIDPQDQSLFKLLGAKFYNKAVELALDDTNVESFLVKDFLESTSNQLTYHGLFELTASLKEGEVAVLFRNNHFSTITKHEDVLYQLVTDQGFVKEDSVVWEALSSVSGDNDFVNSFFQKTSHLHSRETVENFGGSAGKDKKPENDDPDYQLALQLEANELCQNDEEIARRLQEAENNATDNRARGDGVNNRAIEQGNRNSNNRNQGIRTVSVDSGDGNRNTCTIL